MVNVLYSEKVRSNKTSLLFMFLAIIFFALFGWRFSVVGYRFVPGLYAFFGLFFCFYVINFRELEISITDQTLQLKFGVIGWSSNIENIKSSILYDPPFWIKFGGAGFHGRWRLQGVLQLPGISSDHDRISSKTRMGPIAGFHHSAA